MFPDALFDLVAPLLEFGSDVLFTCFLQDACCALELRRHHGVGRDEEAEDGSVIAGAEGAADEACAAVEGVAQAAEAESFCAAVGVALPSVFVAEISACGFVKSGFGLLF